MGSRTIPVFLLALLAWAAVPVPASRLAPASAQEIQEESLAAAAEEEEEWAEVGRTTVVPWSVAVLGKNFDSFPNHEAAIVLGDWLVNSLIQLNVFNVVNRDKMQAILSEQQLAAAGYAQDISPTALADAGKLLKVNYILFGNLKNLGRNSEVDFKLLDVDTATYSHAVNFTIPFNPDIESMKPEIDRIVAKLAAFFPIVAQIGQILDDRQLIVAAGTADGVSEAMEAEVWRYDGSGPEETGFVTGAWERQARVELDRALVSLNLFDYVVQIKIVPPAQAALKKGLRDLDRGAFGEAAASFQKGLEADPDDGLLHANYARSLSKAGDHQAAIDAYRRALSLRPDDVPLLEDAAVAMLASGHAEELIETLEQQQRMTHSAKLALSYGQAQETLGYYRRAEDAYRQALKADPTGAETHLRLAVLAAKQLEVEEAGREFRMAEQGGGDSLEMRLGSEAFRIARAGSEADRAPLESLVEQAKEAGDLAAMSTASEVLLIEGSLWRLSLDLALQTLALTPDYVRASLAAARAHAAGGQRREAVDLLDQALGTSPNNVALLLLSGELLAAGGSFDEAVSRYRRVVELAPGDWRASVALGDLFAARQDHLKAMGAYLEALQRAEAGSAESLVDLLYKLGNAAVLAGQLDTARPYLKRCVEQAPDHIECQFRLGLCYFGDELPESDDKAVASFSAAAELPDASYYLGILHQRQAQFDEALLWHRRCVREGCSLSEQSQLQVDLIESITGQVTQVRDVGKTQKVTLDVGRIHGVRHSQEAVVTPSSSKLTVVRVEEVREDSSVALVLKGTPLVGQIVRFRPTSPKGLRVTPHPKKGVVLQWQTNPEPEVQFYEVLIGSTPSGPWSSKKKVRHPTSELVYKSIKPGQKVFFKVVAVTQLAARSTESPVVEAGSE